MHGYLGLDGTGPLDLLARGREEVEGYGGLVRSGRVVSVARGERFTVALNDGTLLRARQILVATGLHDGLPDVAGLAERWGRDVIHCPYCHGYEVRDQRIVVLATTAMAVHQTLLFRQLSDAIALVLRSATPDADQQRLLSARGVTMGMGSQLPVGPASATSVPGLWVAGNAGDASAQVGAAMAQGAMAGAQINAAMIMEETQRAMASV